MSAAGAEIDHDFARRERGHRDRVAAGNAEIGVLRQARQLLGGIAESFRARRHLAIVQRVLLRASAP